MDPTLINLVYEELNGMFGGYSEQSIVGQWMGEPREDNIGLFVDVQDTPDARKFFNRTTAARRSGLYGFATPLLRSRRR